LNPSEKNLASLILEAKSGFDSVACSVRNIGLTDYRSRIQQEKTRIDQQIARNTETQAKLYEILDTPATRDQLESLTKARPPYREAVNKAVTPGVSENLDERAEAIRIMINEMQTTQAPVFAALDSMTELQKRLTFDATTSALEEARADGAMLLWIAALVGILVSSLIVCTIKSQVGGEPAYAAEVTRQVAEGNLAVAVTLRAGCDEQHA